MAFLLLAVQTAVICIYKRLASIRLERAYKICRKLASMVMYVKVLPMHKTVKQNLSIAFPQLNSSEIASITQQYYYRASEFGAENLHLLSDNAEQPFHVSFHGLDVLTSAFEHTDFVVCYSGHFLNYELLTILPSQFKVAHLLCFYQSSKFHKIDDFITARRSKHGATLIPTSSPTSHILSLFRNNTRHEKYIIGTLADLPAPNSRYTSMLFSRPIHTHTGSERIGRIINAAYVYASVSRINQGNYEIHFKKLTPDPHSQSQFPITDSFMNSLQDNISRDPSLWMLWATKIFN